MTNNGSIDYSIPVPRYGVGARGFGPEACNAQSKNQSMRAKEHFVGIHGKIVSHLEK